MEEILTLLKDKYNLKKENNNLIYGIINDYQVVISFSSRNMEDCYVRIFSNFGLNNTSLTKYLEYRKSRLKLSSFICSSNCLTFHLASTSNNNWLEKVENAILVITDELKKEGYKDASHCINCGEKMINPVDVVIEKTPITVCGKCSRTLFSSIKNRKRAPKKRVGNSFKCTLAAIGGGLLGALIWDFVGYLFALIFYGKIIPQIIVAILLSFIISFLISVGYDKRNGEKGKKKIVTNIVVSYVSILLAINGFYIILACFETKEDFPKLIFYILSYLIEYSPVIIAEAFVGMLFGSIVILPYNLIYLSKEI